MVKFFLFWWRFNSAFNFFEMGLGFTLIGEEDMELAGGGRGVFGRAVLRFI